VRIVLPDPKGAGRKSIEVDPAQRPTRVQSLEEAGDVFLEWDQAIDDDGHLRRCLCCAGPLYRRKAFPQVTGFVIVLAFALSLVGILGFADNIGLLVVMTIVLLMDISILLFARTYLDCYRCGSSHRKLTIASYHRSWDRATANRNRAAHTDGS
tara:strand:- start:2094 stop:2555 length:462 start_codon:yes stop_codon:yes gene_type:complete